MGNSSAARTFEDELFALCDAAGISHDHSVIREVYATGVGDAVQCAYSPPAAPPPVPPTAPPLPSLPSLAGVAAALSIQQGLTMHGGDSVSTWALLAGAICVFPPNTSQ